MLIIGGSQSTMSKKIAKVDGCGIKSHGALPEAMLSHDCSVYEPENYDLLLVRNIITSKFSHSKTKSTALVRFDFLIQTCFIPCHLFKPIKISDK